MGKYPQAYNKVNGLLVDGTDYCYGTIVMALLVLHYMYFLSRM